jgi:two-component system, NarL family, nitrate/nitrite response regulator NarL
MEHFEALRQIPKLGARAHDSLTTRERQIVLVLSEGLSNKEIGRRLRLTEGTVKVHLHNIYQKLGISNRTALAVLARRTTP